MDKDIKFPIAAFLVLLLLVPASSGFGLGGGIIREEISPGQDLIRNIIVSSSENRTLNMTATIYGFSRTMDGTDIGVLPKDDTGPFTARPFLTIEPNSFRLDPGESETLTLEGKVPEDIGPGGKYALIEIRTAPIAKTGTGVSISAAIHGYALLTVKEGDLIQTGNITVLETSQNEKGLAVNLTFENTGNVHYKPFVEAILKSQSGETLAEAEVKDGPPSFVLPMNSYLFKMNLLPEGDLAPGKYIIEGEVTLEDGTVLDSKETEFEI